MKILLVTIAFLFLTIPAHPGKLSKEKICANIGVRHKETGIEIIEIRKKAIETAIMYEKCLIVGKGRSSGKTPYLCKSIKDESWSLMQDYELRKMMYQNNLKLYNDCRFELMGGKLQ